MFIITSAAQRKMKVIVEHRQTGIEWLFGSGEALKLLVSVVSLQSC